MVEQRVRANVAVHRTASLIDDDNYTNMPSSRWTLTRRQRIWSSSTTLITAASNPKARVTLASASG